MNVAYKIREEIVKLENTVLPDHVSLKAVIENDVKIPQMLEEFVRCLLIGPDQRYGKTDDVNRKVQSLCNDAIYSITKGLVKPGKHIQLGLVMKSLTSSRKVIEILNRFGHCVNYHFIEELETELAFSSDCLHSSNLPQGMLNIEEVCTGVAFDNYDRYVETNTGKNTLHDTVGIAYQIMIPSLHTAEPTNESFKNTTSRKRRAYVPSNTEIEPYHKKPKILATFPNVCSSKELYKSSLNIARDLDYIWLVTLFCDRKNTPMWTGWNSNHVFENLPLQNVFYLSPINASPTSYSVVLETLKRSIKIADDCQQKYIFVTYDLAIAKIAFQIQHEESPSYDRAFIMLGSFHIEMAFYKAIGKFLEGSGGEIALVNAEVLAQGSLNAFISGTHYNRCKRLHVLLSAAIQLLHFEAFIKKENISGDDLQADIDLLETNGMDAGLPESLALVISKYTVYEKNTLKGHHGPTAAFWMNYVQMINLKNDFSRSVRCGDLNLYIYCLNEMASFFFTLNHQNYARWTVKAAQNLRNMSETHPDLVHQVQTCGFGVKRTEKCFSMSPVDLTLEQTINADAANRLTGVSSFTNSIAARQKWAKTHADRTANISSLYNMLGMLRKDDITRDLKRGQIKKFSEDLKKLTTEIENFSNPFSDATRQQSERLFNICTGKCVTQPTEQFLLDLKQLGENKRDAFLNECEVDPKRFENPISKTKILNFASEYKVANTVAGGKILEIKMERNLIGRILFIASQNSLQIDMKQIFKYPLTPVPQSFGHLDGSMIKTDKSAFLRHLEKTSVSIPPTQCDVMIVDGFYLLHTLGEVSASYVEIAAQILKKICRLKAKEIHLVFDRIISPSIKDIERDRRNNSDDQIVYSAFSKNGRRPANFIKSLRNSSFKKRLNEWLVEEWSEDEYHFLIGDKKLYVTFETKCFVFSASNEKMVREEVIELESLQEEADTRMILHLAYLPPNLSVVLKTVDTDVLIIALNSLPHLKNEAEVWLEIGNISKNSLRYIHLNEMFVSLGPELCAALPAFHSLTGCDYTPSFFKKGKVKPFEILKASAKYQHAFSKFGQFAYISEEDIATIEEFVCKIYKTTALSVNDARYELFYKTCKPTSKKIFKNIKSFEGSLLPPSRSVLLQQINRCNYICHVWKNATSNTGIKLSPFHCGWTMEDDMVKLKWFNGVVAPETIENLLSNDGNNSDEDNIEQNSSSDESDEE